MKYLLYFALAGLYLLHNDLFLWNDDCLIGGFPSGLLYHAAYCVAASVLMFLLVRFAWPSELDVSPDQTE
jgi:hypothetical protein